MVHNTSCTNIRQIQGRIQGGICVDAQPRVKRHRTPIYVIKHSSIDHATQK